MSDHDAKPIVIWFAAAAILAALAGNLLHIAFDQSAIWHGVDQNFYNRFCEFQSYHGPFNFRLAVYESSYQFSLLYFPTGLLAKAFGLQSWLLFVMPMLGFALMLVFAYLIGKRLGGATAGWLAAAALSMTPFAFGVARRFDSWPLIMAVYLGLAYAVMRFEDRPNYKRALLIGLFGALSLASAHDNTSFALTALYTAGPLAWAAWLALAAPEQPAWKRLSNTALMFAGVAVWLYFFWLGAGIRNGYAAYFQREWNTAVAQVNWVYGLGGYVAAFWYDMFGPVVMIPLVAGWLAFPWLSRRRKELVWFAFSLGAFLAFSAIPKKNLWYILDALALAPVFAAVSFTRLLNRLNPRAATVVGVALPALLLGQYVYCLFVPLSRSEWLKSYTSKTIQQDVSFPERIHWTPERTKPHSPPAPATNSMRPNGLELTPRFSARERTPWFAPSRKVEPLLVAGSGP